jgi:hypothetical protein
MNFKWLKLTGVQALLATQAEPALQLTTNYVLHTLAFRFH